MSFAPQCSPPWCHLPASTALLLLLLAPPATAQSTVRLAQQARVYKSPGAQVLGTLLPGAELTQGQTSGNATEVTFEGWIITSSLGPTNRDGFTLAVDAGSGENLRAVPNSTVIARLSPGVGLIKLTTQGGWTRVRRTAWVDTKSLPDGPSLLSASLPAGTTSADRAQLNARAPMLVAPGGVALGSVDSGAGVRVLARSGGWSRVQLEAWISDSALNTAPAGVLVGLSQAEVRANPTRYIGQVVEWRLQYVAVQKADQLRPEIPEGATYLLTRGPLPEPGFVYVIVPAAQAAQFEALAPLKELRVRGTIRSATTKYLPTPVLELVAVMEGLGT